MDQFIKVAGTEGKVGGYFCRLPPLNENTDEELSSLKIPSVYALVEVMPKNN